MDPSLLPSYLDLANHHANSTEADIRKLCENVLQYKFNSAFVNPYYVPLCREIIKDQGRVGTVISFPLGQELLSVKISSALAAIKAGADELDTCLNVGLIKEGKWDQSLTEMKAILDAVKNTKPAIVVKFIPEVAFLTPDEIRKMAELMVEVGADFFKTGSGSIGGAPRGPTIEDVKLIRETVGNKIKIKVTGGISTYEEAISFINAGVDRIGTSHAVEILEGSTAKKIGNRTSE